VDDLAVTEMPGDTGRCAVVARGIELVGGAEMEVGAGAGRRTAGAAGGTGVAGLANGDGDGTVTTFDSADLCQNFLKIPSMFTSWLIQISSHPLPAC